MAFRKKNTPQPNDEQFVRGGPSKDEVSARIAETQTWAASAMKDQNQGAKKDGKEQKAGELEHQVSEASRLLWVLRDELGLAHSELLAEAAKLESIQEDGTAVAARARKAESIINNHNTSLEYLEDARRRHQVAADALGAHNEEIARVEAYLAQLHEATTALEEAVVAELAVESAAASKEQEWRSYLEGAEQALMEAEQMIVRIGRRKDKIAELQQTIAAKEAEARALYEHRASAEAASDHYRTKHGLGPVLHSPVPEPSEIFVETVVDTNADYQPDPFSQEITGGPGPMGPFVDLPAPTETEVWEEAPGGFSEGFSDPEENLLASLPAPGAKDLVEPTANNAVVEETMETGEQWPVEAGQIPEDATPVMQSDVEDWPMVDVPGLEGEPWDLPAPGVQADNSSTSPEPALAWGWNSQGEYQVVPFVPQHPEGYAAPAVYEEPVEIDPTGNKLTVKTGDMLAQPGVDDPAKAPGGGFESPFDVIDANSHELDQLANLPMPGEYDAPVHAPVPVAATGDSTSSGSATVNADASTVMDLTDGSPDERVEHADTSETAGENIESWFQGGFNRPIPYEPHHPEGYEAPQAYEEPVEIDAAGRPVGATNSANLQTDIEKAHPETQLAEPSTTAPGAQSDEAAGPWGTAFDLPAPEEDGAWGTAFDLPAPDGYDLETTAPVGVTEPENIHGIAVEDVSDEAVAGEEQLLEEKAPTAVEEEARVTDAATSAYGGLEEPEVLDDVIHVDELEAWWTTPPAAVEAESVAEKTATPETFYGETDKVTDEEAATDTTDGLDELENYLANLPEAATEDAVDTSETDLLNGLPLPAETEAWGAEAEDVEDLLDLLPAPDGQDYINDTSTPDDPYEAFDLPAPEEIDEDIWQNSDTFETETDVLEPDGALEKEIQALVDAQTEPEANVDGSQSPWNLAPPMNEPFDDTEPGTQADEGFDYLAGTDLVGSDLNDAGLNDADLNNADFSMLPPPPGTDLAVVEANDYLDEDAWGDLPDPDEEEDEVAVEEEIEEEVDEDTLLNALPVPDKNWITYGLPEPERTADDEEEDEVEEVEESNEAESFVDDKEQRRLEAEERRLRRKLKRRAQLLGIDADELGSDPTMGGFGEGESRAVVDPDEIVNYKDLDLPEDIPDRPNWGG